MKELQDLKKEKEALIEDKNILSKMFLESAELYRNNKKINMTKNKSIDVLPKKKRFSSLSMRSDENMSNMDGNQSVGSLRFRLKPGLNKKTLIVEKFNQNENG